VLYVELWNKRRRETIEKCDEFEKNLWKREYVFLRRG